MFFFVKEKLGFFVGMGVPLAAAANYVFVLFAPQSLSQYLYLVLLRKTTQKEVILFVIEPPRP